MAHGSILRLLSLVLLLASFLSTKSFAKRYDFPITAGQVAFATEDSSAWILTLELPAGLRSHRLDYAMLDLYVSTSDSRADGEVVVFRVAPVEEMNPGARTFSSRAGNWSGQTLVTGINPGAVRLEVTRLLQDWRANEGQLQFAVERRDANENARIAVTSSGPGGIVGHLRVYLTER